MTKATIKRLFPKKQWCIAHNVGFDMTYYWEGGLMWYLNRKDAAYVGTKREMEIILNKRLYQDKIRGAKVVKF